MGNYNSENWMKGISGDKLISDISIPGTHDSGTKNVKKEIKKYQCQGLSISDQMKIGVRYFDIRCANGKDDEQYIKHGSIFCLNECGNTLTLDDLITVGKDFLRRNPTETLIYQIKNEGGDSKKLCDYLGKYIETGILWSKDYIPHIREVRGKIILVRRFSFKNNKFNFSENEYGINLKWWDIDCFCRMYLDTFVHVNSNAWVQDRYPVEAKEKYGLIQRAIAEMNNLDEEPSKEWAICLSSCTKPTPIDAANEINGKLLSPQSPLNAKKLGTFVVDFATEALIRKIYMTNF